MPDHNSVNITKFDWARLPNLLLLIVIFVLSRIPLLDLGFGLDADAWRIANSAYDIKHHLLYHASRFPGYPVPEFVNSLVIGHGWSATNGLTMVISLFSLIMFVYIQRILDGPNRGLLTLAYAFLPILWINSTNTMDYMWSLCFILLAWFLILRGKYMISGLLFGLAIGSRPSSIVFVLPFLFLVHGHEHGVKNTVKFLAITILTTIVLYAPVFAAHGWSFIRSYPAQTSLLQTGYMAVKHFGLPALAMLPVLIVSSIHGIRNLMSKHGLNDTFIVLSVGVALITFALMPYHIEYLIPAMPFILLLLGRIAKTPVLIVICLLSLCHAFLTIGNFQHLENNTIRTQLIDQGALINDIEARQQQLTFARNLIAAPVTDHSVVILGPWLPILAYLDEDVSSAPEVKKMYDCNSVRAQVCNFKHDLCYRYLLTSDEVEELLASDYRIYYIEGIREFTKDVYDYDLADFETIYLRIMPSVQGA